MWYPGSSGTNGAEEAADNSPSKPQTGLPGWPSLPLKTGSAARWFFSEVAAGVEDVLRRAGLNLLLFNIGDNDIASDVGAGADSFQYSGSDAPTVSTPGDPSEYFPDLEVESVYEDAEHDLPTSAVPHEEREDAFDYENFFLLLNTGQFQ